MALLGIISKAVDQLLLEIMRKPVRKIDCRDKIKAFQENIQNQTVKHNGRKMLHTEKIT